MKKGFLLSLIIAYQVFATTNIKLHSTVPANNSSIKFGHLVDFTVDENGNIYFLDSELAKVFCFDKDGNSLQEVAHIKQGLLKEPTSIEISKNNNIIVLDSDLKKVLTFTNAGEIISSFGNSSGYWGSFDSPIDMAIDASSNIYVVDEGNESILKFNESGLFRGGIKLTEPIAIDVDGIGNIHVLTKSNYGYQIEVFKNNFEKIKNIALSEFVEPTHLSINSFNEYYVVDSEKGNALYLDSLGKPLSNSIGVKSSNRGRQQFSEPTRVLSKFKSDSEDLLFLMDSDFGEIQSFVVETDLARKKVKTLLPKYNLKIVEDSKRVPAIDIVFDKVFEYLISTNNTIICTENNASKYTIQANSFASMGTNISEPVALEKYNNNLYILDKDENKIIVANAEDGSFNFAFAEGGSTSGKLDSPTDIVADNSGNLYVADVENKRVNIYSNDGIFKSEIPLPNVNPYKLACDDNSLFILTDSKEQIFIVDLISKKLSALPLKKFIQEPKISSITSLFGGYLIVSNEADGVIYIFKNKNLFAQFLSKGSDASSINEISTLGFNKSNKHFVLFDNNTQRQLTVKFSIAPQVPTDIKFTVDEKGDGTISWENNDENTSFFTVSRKKFNDKNLFPLLNVDTNFLKINYKNSDAIYVYAVQSVSADSFKSDFSKNVADEYSFYLKLKETDPKQSVEKLLSIKELNEKVILHQVINIYTSELTKATNSNNYDLAFSYYEKLKKIAPTNPDIYIDESNLYKKLLKFREGSAKLEEALITIPDNLKIWTQLIRLQSLDKNYEGVTKSCNSALKIFPDNEKILVSLAESYTKLNKTYEASGIYKDLAIKKNSEMYFVKAGNLLVESNLIQDAINLYQLAENSGVEGAKLYAAKGKAYIEKGDFPNGEFQIEKSIKLDNQNPESYYYLALANSKKRNMRGAIEAYKKSIELDDSNFKVLLDYGLDLKKINKYDDAIVAFERALEINPSSGEAAFNLGRIYALKKNLDLAVKHLQTANKLFPENTEISTELHNAYLAREKYNASRPPIEITVVDFDNIFPSFLGYYASQPAGTVTLFNTKNEVYGDILIEISAPNLLSSPSKLVVPIIYPNEVSENLVYFQFDNSIITKSLNEDTDYDVTVTASYMKGEKSEKIEKKSKIRVYKLNSISWKDKKHLASFINPGDENLRKFVTSEIIAKTSFNDERFSKVPKPILQAAQVWEYLRQMNLNYVQDPNSSYEKVSLSDDIDYVQFPTQTLETKVGDCDDLVTLLSNALEVIGIETAYIDVPGHVFLAFNTGLNPGEIESIGLSTQQVIIKFNKVWFPLESTVIGKNSFVESWNSASQRYRTEKKANSAIEIVGIQDAAATFPPTTYPIVKPIVSNVNVDIVKSELEKDLTSFRQTREKTYEEELLRVLNSYPKNIHTFNKLGLYYARKGDLEQAEIYFTRTLQYDKGNLVALVNLGNVMYQLKAYDSADRRYKKALQHDQQNVGILANLVRCNMKLGNKKAAVGYYQAIEQIDPEYLKNIKEISKK